MAREIKFRAWNGSHLLEWDWWDWIVAMGYTSTVICNAENRYQVMQYTGLKDKNDKEIYEGDIVRVVFQMSATDVPEIYNEVISDIRSIPSIKGSSRTSEVIGNIYENPELLEKGEA